MLYYYTAIREPISIKSCRKIVRLLISAIREMDSKGIGHRDLKLENIMMDKQF